MTNGTFRTIGDKVVIDLIISYFAFTALAPRLQNMNNDPVTAQGSNLSLAHEIE